MMFILKVIKDIGLYKYQYKISLSLFLSLELTGKLIQEQIFPSRKLNQGSHRLCLSDLFLHPS